MHGQVGNYGLIIYECFSWWTEEMQSYELSARVFGFLRNGKDHLVKADFKDVIRELIDTHPGLEFLKATPEFQDKYGISWEF